EEEVAPVPAGSITTPNTWSGSSLTVTSGSANGSVSGFSQAPAVPNQAVLLVANSTTSTISGGGETATLPSLVGPDITSGTPSAAVQPPAPPPPPPDPESASGFRLAAWQHKKAEMCLSEFGPPQEITAPQQPVSIQDLFSGRPVNSQVNLSFNTGDQTTFKVITNFSYPPPPGYYTTITATCQAVRTNCYIFVDNNVSLSGGTITDLADTFASTIYPRDTSTFGSEWNPGIDGDSHVFILITNVFRGTGVGGYFNPGDENPSSPSNPSNQKEILYVDSSYSTFLLKAIIAHEFQHMINYNQKDRLRGVTEDTWLNEGLSRYAEDVCGFGMPQGNSSTASQVKTFLTSPYNYSLALWPPNFTGVHYAASYLFVLYVAEHYPGSISSIMTSSYTGTANVANATGESFATTFQKWAVTLYYDGLVSNPEYNYTSIHLHSTYSGYTLNGANAVSVTTYPSSLAFTAQPWTAYYYSYTSTSPAAKTLTVTATGLSSSAGVFLFYK
ncbi:MAG: hypothetical protein M1536_08285, partial [Firmicutes bacterium]|nr:hypothetical protein [Bacillota bacterium]